MNSPWPAESRQESSDGSSPRDPWIAAAACGITLVLCAPIVWPERFLSAAADGRGISAAGAAVALLLPLLAVAAAWWFWLPEGGRSRVLALGAALLLSGWCVDLHYSNVDLGRYFEGLFTDNVHWQKWLHAGVLRLDAAAPTPGDPAVVREVIPHSYRFLPDCLLAWMMLLTHNYLAAALIYRLTFQFLLYIALFRFARRWLNVPCALLAMLLFALVYPPSIRYYAGQLTDPLSHLSFVLGMIFMESRRWWLFAATVTIGVLAKESILVLPVYACLANARVSVWMWCGSVFVGGLALALLVRYVVARDPAFENISGLAPDHFISNLRDVSHWFRQTWHTVGALLMIAALSWRSVPAPLRRLGLFLAAALWMSNLFLSHLMEARNLVPAAVPLATMAAAALSSWIGADASVAPRQATAR